MEREHGQVNGEDLYSQNGTIEVSDSERDDIEIENDGRDGGLNDNFGTDLGDVKEGNNTKPRDFLLKKKE